VYANNNVPLNKWIDAGEGKLGKAEDKVKSKFVDLAYRPVWQAGYLRIAHPIGSKSYGNRILPPTHAYLISYGLS
jgi:hypothetical protein